MSKNLTSNIIANKSKRYGTEPINLLEIEFGGVTGTKYYSDREVTVGGNTYEAVVKDWGDIDFILNKSATTSDIHITLINTLSSPISNIFSVDNPESKVAKLYQWYMELDEADKTLLFNGRITSPIKYTLDTVELDIVDRILDLETKIGRVITVEEFPRSLPSHRGKIVPQVVGSVENVPAVCVFTAGKSALRESLSESLTTVEADDGSVFPSDATWVLIIEDEQILMEPNTSGGNVLTATQRGYNGTSDVLHTKGTQMYEQLSSFRYQVFDDQFSVKAAAISNVRVNGILIPDTDYTIDQVNYPGQIIFDTYPQIDQEKETDFDEYVFDTVVDNGLVPFASTPEALTDENNSNYASLKSGQRTRLQRVAPLDNSNQFKRAWLVVKYFTDKQEWNGNIQARVYWDTDGSSVNLGLLPDPTFDPLTEEEIELASAAENPIVNPYNPVDPTKYGGVEDMIKGPESGLISENYSEEVDPSSLSIETVVVDLNRYTIPLGTDLLNPDFSVKPEAYTAYVDGLAGRVIGFQSGSVLFPGTWGSDVANLSWIHWVYGGFSFSLPGGTTTARISNINIRYSDEFGPGTAGSMPWEYRIKKKGVRALEIINPGPRIYTTGLKMTPMYVHEIEAFYLVFRTFTYITPRVSFSAGEFGATTIELFGKIHDVYLEVSYEITKEAPEQQAPSVIILPPVTMPRAVRKSHEVEKTFEITNYVDNWGDLLNKTADIVFESDGNQPGSNLYIKDMHILTESGKYTFEYTDEITADVDGFYVDGTEIDTNYGDTGELLYRPDQVFKLMLTWNSIFSLSDLDLTAYDVAAIFYNTQYYRLDFAIVEETTLRKVLEKMAFQTRTDQYWEAGEHRIKVLEVSTAATKQVTASDIETMAIERSDISDLVNLLEVRYSVDYSFLIDYTPNKFRDIITIENPGSQSEYGVRKSKDETFYLDYIRDDVTASHVANYYLSFYSVMRRYVNMRCFLNQLELDKHDIIGVSFPLDNLSNTPGRVLSNKFSMGGGNELDQIELYILMEDYTYHKLELVDGLSFSEAIQLALIPLVSLADALEFSDSINFGFEVNLADTILFSDVLSYTMLKTLFIREGYESGWGSQPWGSSAWGGNSKSFLMADELTLDRILAEGTGIIDTVNTVSIADYLLLLLTHRPYIVDSDAFNLLILIDEDLTITKV